MILNLFLSALKMRKAKRPKSKCHPKFLAFHMENQEVGLNKHWPVCRDQLELDSLSLAQLYPFLGMLGGKLFKILIKIWRKQK